MVPLGGGAGIQQILLRREAVVLTCKLLLDDAGNLYGTTESGGPFQIESGVAFQIKTR